MSSCLAVRLAFNSDLLSILTTYDSPSFDISNVDNDVAAHVDLGDGDGDGAVSRSQEYHRK